MSLYVYLIFQPFLLEMTLNLCNFRRSFLSFVRHLQQPPSKNICWKTNLLALPAAELQRAAGEKSLLLHLLLLLEEKMEVLGETQKITKDLQQQGKT